ncbi:MAG TPA: 6-phosphogluconolactonase [Acidimicrobiia bacterium]|nr:6-phosphogluconolactonase [Acidimicrobiia bacterium]
MEVSVHPDRAALAGAVADTIAALASNGPISVGLAGGSTPTDTYEALHDRRIDWESVTLWLSDERWVPHDHPDSNGAMALRHLPEGAAARLLRPPYSTHLHAEDSAVHYEARLRLVHDGRPPDLVLLGMGADGHTASLFPGSPALDAGPSRWYVAHQVPSLDAWRLTATPSLLQTVSRILVLVSGEDKATTLAEALEGPDGLHPIQLLRRATGAVTVHCDRAAAAALSR